MNLIGVLEGLLFIVGDEGVTLEDICKVLEIDEIEAKRLLTELKNIYENTDRGIRISFLGNSFKLTTKKEYKEYYQKLVKEKDENLSQAQLEVLAIIAYNEPITRVEIDDLRGISSIYVLKKLLAMDLVRIAGKSDLPGKPNLYKTTSNFLDYFGLASLNDLPKVNINEENNDELLFKKKSIETE